MSKKRGLIRDEYGYINDQGKSRYWGVTTSILPTGKSRWVVSILDYRTGMTQNYLPQWDNPKEEDMALVAAALYENNRTPPSKKILSADKKYVMWMEQVPGRIYRERYRNQELYEFNPTVTLFGDMFEDEEQPIVERNPKPKGPFKPVEVKKERSTGYISDQEFIQIISLLSTKKIKDYQGKAIVAILNEAL